MPPLPVWLKRLFGSGSPPSIDPNTEAIALIQPSGWDDDLSMTLSQIATETETKASGRVQVITLAHLRHSLGEQWETYRPKVELIAETTIGRMIGKGNVYIPQEEDSWLLLMPSLTDSEAESKANEIAGALGEKLVGERFTEREPPMPQAAKVDLAGALRADGSLDLEAVRQSVKRSRLALAARDAKRSVAALGGPPAEAPISSGTATSHFSELTLTFRPAWSADTESIDTFSLRAFDPLGELVLGRTELKSTFQMDDATFADVTKSALGEFALMTKSGLRAKFALPLPFAMTRRRIGPAIFRAITALPQRDRLMHLRIEIVGIPMSAPSEHLFELREFFRGRVRDVAFLVQLSEPVPQVFTMEHIVVGADIPVIEPDIDLKRALIDFRRMAGGRRTYVMGLRSRDAVSAALHAGFDELSGAGLGDDVRHLPDRIAVLHRNEILSVTPPQF